MVTCSKTAAMMCFLNGANWNCHWHVASMSSNPTTALSSAKASSSPRSWGEATFMISPKQQVPAWLSWRQCLAALSQSEADWNCTFTCSDSKRSALNIWTAALMDSSAVPAPENSVLIEICLEIGESSDPRNGWILRFQDCAWTASRVATEGAAKLVAEAAVFPSILLQKQQYIEVKLSNWWNKFDSNTY